MTPDGDRPTNLSPWAWAVVGLAGAKTVVAIVAFVVAAITGAAVATVVPLWFLIAMVIGYGSVAAVLLAGGAMDVRARTLGAVLLLAASAFADSLSSEGQPLSAWARLAANIRVDALLPWFFWFFARRFPVSAPPGRWTTLSNRLGWMTLSAGLGLVGANTVLDFGGIGPGDPSHRVLLLLSRNAPGSVYWPALFVMMLPAALVLAVRARHSKPAERRRVAVFVAAVLIGLLPIAIDIILRAASSAWNARVTEPVTGLAVASFVMAALLSVPFTTAYCVLVSRVVDVRLLVRSALQYAFARYSVLGLVALPFGWLAWFVFANRHATVQELLFGRLALIVVAWFGVGVAAMRVRKPVLTALDRRFFREQYDAQRILSSLVESARHVDSSGRLAELLAAEIDHALHIERVAVLVPDAAGASYVAFDGSTRPLAADSVLVRLMSGTDEPFDVDLDAPRSPLRRLSTDEQAWLTEGGFRLVVPLRDSAGSVTGIVALGEKRSDVPYSAKDRRLLAAVGASGGLYLESRRARETPVRTTPGEPSVEGGEAPALECAACGLVYGRPSDRCTCGSTLTDASVPRSLAGKFLVECRVGRGGMGIVYKAEDEALGRSVALKTLPRVSPDRVARLRREARAMASVTHTNLEVIYGLETWRDRPVLVVEYLGGGTLRNRLARGCVPLAETVALGTALADALEALHGHGLLHRDIKPGNIGFSTTGTPKLLDFGVAKLFSPELEAAAAQASAGSSTDQTTGPTDIPQELTASLIGTPPYMAPEAIRRELPRPSFDLWALAVVLFEALAGINPFHGASVPETLSRIQSATPPDLRAFLRGSPETVAAFFDSVLAPDWRKRPTTSREFKRRLADLGPAAGGA